jgi:hypothetical protein
VAAHGYGEAEGFNAEPAEHEDGAGQGSGKEEERGDGENESGWHDQQSGVFHGLSLEGAAEED